MKINKHKNQNISEDYIDLYYKKETDEIKAIIDYVNSRIKILGKNETGQKMIIPQDIYYIEAVDKKIFTYLKSEVYQIDRNLQDIEQILDNMGVVRINKSTLVNIHHIEKVKADINMRLCLTMDNTEKLIVNRTYKKKFINYLKEIERRINNEDK